MTRKNSEKCPQPSMIPASMIVVGIVRKKAVRTKTVKGIPKAA